MKKKWMLSAMALAMMACSSADEIIDTPVEPGEAQYVEVNFGLAGEISDITQTPLKSAARDTSTLYGLQVLSTKNGSEHFYAYAVYDDPSQMKIRLVKDQTYRFVCSSVIDGKNKLNISEYGWNAPFALNSSNNTDYSYNKFTYSTTANMYYVVYGNGYSYLKNGGWYYRPNTDRYHGEIRDYAPVEGGSVQIDMKRMTFGAKFIAKGLTEGKLIIAMEYAPEMTIENPMTEVQDLFTFRDICNPNSWAYDKEDENGNPAPYEVPYYEDVAVAINWEKSNGDKLPIAAQNIRFTRNKLTTVTVTVSDESLEGNIGVSTENDPMTDGNNVEVGGGSSTETPVEPVTK